MDDVHESEGQDAIQVTLQLLADEADKEAVGEKQSPLLEHSVSGLYSGGQSEKNLLEWLLGRDLFGDKGEWFL